MIARLCRHLLEQRAVNQDTSLDAIDDAQRQNMMDAGRLQNGSDIEKTDLIKTIVHRIDVHRDRVELQMQPSGEGAPTVLTAAAALIRSGRQTRLVPPGVQASGIGVLDEGLIRLVANAHAARSAIVDAGSQSIEVIAEANGFTPHYFAQLARLGGLAPDIVTAILEGRQPACLTRTRLARTKALPLDWTEQRAMFGFA